MDDGSEDGSDIILEKWRQKDSRIKIIRQCHSGLSAARNAAISCASGKYITFVDADDMVEREIYSNTMHLMSEFSLDVLEFSYATFPYGGPVHHSLPLNRVMDYKDLFRLSHKIQTSNSLCFCWRFLIRASIIKNNRLRFDESIKIGEDMVFMVDTICHSSRIMAIDDSLYLHRIDNANSLMTMRFNPDLVPSFSRMYAVKKRQIKEYGLADESDYVNDLHNYSILVYLPKFIRNTFNDPYSDKNVAEQIRRIFDLDIIKEAFDAIGFRNIYSTKKEYFFYLVQKFKIMPLVIKGYSRMYAEDSNRNK